MDTTLLLSDTCLPPTDAALLNAVPAPAPEADGRMALTIGIEDAAGRIYRVVRLHGLCEAVRFFEVARGLGFLIGRAITTPAGRFQKVLRWVGPMPAPFAA